MDQSSGKYIRIMEHVNRGTTSNILPQTHRPLEESDLADVSKRANEISIDSS